MPQDGSGIILVRGGAEELAFRKRSPHTSPQVVAALGGGKAPFLPGKAFNTRSVLRAGNEGVFLGLVLGWEVT